MSDSGTAPAERDTAEYERRIAALRKLMTEHGFDAIIASDDDLTLGQAFGDPPKQAPYARYLAGFSIPSGLHPHAIVVVVPQSGEPTLIVPPGIERSFAHLARARSWIRNVVDGYVVGDPEWEAATRWGLMANRLAVQTADVLTAAGLGTSRIGVVGRWASQLADLDELRGLLPEAHLEPTFVSRNGGPPTDLLVPLIESNSDWEIEKLEVSHAAADAMMRTFVAAARAGASVREARIDTLAAGARAGADDIVLFGSIGVDPWTYWDWSLPVADEFQHGRLYLFQVAVAAHAGYEVQTARSFVVGEPTAAQVRLIDAAEQALRAACDATRPGATGGQISERGVQPIKGAGLELWAQLGHAMGYKAHAAPRGLSFVPGNGVVLTDRQAVVVHPCVVDHATGDSAMIGDTILVDSAAGGFRPLSKDPVPYGLDGR